MLILSRKKGESIMIGDNIEIIVTDVDRGKVRIGINAPRSIQVDRREIYEQRKIAESSPVPLSHSNPGLEKKEGESC